MESREQRGGHRPDRRPRVRVHGAAEEDLHRPQQLARRGRCKHGPLELHLTQTHRSIFRASALLHDLQRQERRLRRRRLPTQRRPGPPVVQKVSARPLRPNVNTHMFTYTQPKATLSADRGEVGGRRGSRVCLRKAPRLEGGPTWTIEPPPTGFANGGHFIERALSCFPPDVFLMVGRNHNV
jgi:hypothetical protein